GSLFSTSSVCLCLRLALDSSLFTYTTLFRSGCLVGFVVHGFEAVCAVPVVEDLLWGVQLHDFVDGLVQDSVSLLVFVVWPYWQVFASEFFYCPVELAFCFLEGFGWFASSDAESELGECGSPHDCGDDHDDWVLCPVVVDH